MKIGMIRSAVLCAAAMGLALVGRAAAMEPVSGFYVSLGGGVDFLQDITLSPASADGPSKRAYEFAPGFGFDPALGYGFGNGLRIELEGDYAQNNLSGLHASFAGHATGTAIQYGVFANAIYDLPLNWPVTPYFGAGVGYQVLELDKVGSAAVGTPLSPTLSPAEGALAYQGIVGISYRLPTVAGLSLTAEYRMIGVTTPPPYLRGMTNPPDLATLGNIFNHEVLVGLRYEFGPARMPSP
jgi:OmpA-OmpF porin, OOP family